MTFKLEPKDETQFETIEQVTEVVFRVFKTDGDVVALFPNEIADLEGNCMSYQRIGQHGAATYNHCISISRPAMPAEYASLKRELESIGYILKIIKKKGA